MSETSGEIIEFVSRVLEGEGALVEIDGDGRIEAVLPAALGERLEVSDDLIHFVGGESSSDRDVSCGYGSEALTRLVDVAVGSGRVCAFDAGLPPREAKGENPVTGLNVACRAVSCDSETVSILVGTVRYTAVGDDERIGQTRAAVLSPGNVALHPPDLASVLSSGRVIGAEEIDAARLETAFPALLSELRRQVATELEGFRKALARRKTRDAHRLVRYFTDMIGDFSRRLRRSSSPASSPLRSKLEALPAEFDRRLQQLRAENMLRVKLDLLGLEIIAAPGLVLELEVKRRKKTRRLRVVYDGLARRWLGLRCQGCGAATLAIALCDDAKHVLCAECWNECGTGGHRPCFRCAGKSERKPWAHDSSAQSSASVSGIETHGPGPGEILAERSVVDDFARADAPQAESFLQTTMPPLEELRSRIIDVLRREGKPLSSGEIRGEVPVDAPVLRRLLQPLLRSGRVEGSGERRGRRYRWKGSDPSGREES